MLLSLYFCWRLPTLFFCIFRNVFSWMLKLMCRVGGGDFVGSNPNTYPRALKCCTCVQCIKICTEYIVYLSTYEWSVRTCTQWTVSEYFATYYFVRPCKIWISLLTDHTNISVFVGSIWNLVFISQHRSVHSVIRLGGHTNGNRFEIILFNFEIIRSRWVAWYLPSGRELWRKLSTSWRYKNTRKSILVFSFLFENIFELLFLMFD